MQQTHINILVVIVFIVFAVLFYFVSLGEGTSTAFLTIATFLFAIFAGFFIARQGRRYSTIRDQIARFDGNISFMYRAFGHFEGYQEKVQKVIKEHYKTILDKKQWDYPLTHKTVILSSTHNLLEEVISKEDVSNSQNMVLTRIVAALRDAQVARKAMVALHQERIPKAQWILIYFLTAILLITLAAIPSQFIVFAALLKAAFATTVIFVMFLLHRFDTLRFFGSVIGERSAQDILDIIEGKR